MVSAAPVRVGDRVSRETRLLSIDATRVPDARVDELRTESASLGGRVQALRRHQERLRSLTQDLQQRFNSYKDSMVRRVAHELEEARSEAEAAETALRQRTSEEAEEQTRVRRGLGSQRELNQARFTAEIASKVATRANTAVERLTDQLESMKRGVFTGPGDSRNDVPYSQQRIHELTVQDLDLEARIQESEARIAQLDNQLETELKRSGAVAAYDMKSPVDGIVWRLFVAPGSAVGPQTRLVQVASTAEVFIDAALDAKYADEIRPGDLAMVRLIGSDVEAPATVKYLLGSEETRADDTLAAQPPTTTRQELHVIMSFEQPPAGAPAFNQDFIGRRAEVRFPGVTHSVLRMR